ncbi:EGF-like domain-containing protein [Entamoeba marina]
MFLLTITLFCSVFAVESFLHIPFCKQIIEQKCVDCVNGYVLNNGICTYGKDIIPHCYTFQNNECIQCFNGYHLFNGECNKNDPLCISYENNQCQKCKDGYALIDNTCEKCKIIGCADCNNNINECNWCEHQFLNINGSCIQTIDGCDTYLNPLFEKSPCLQCRTGFWDENNACVKNNIEHCMSVDNNHLCSMCFDPYSLDQNSRQCVLKKQNGANQQFQYTPQNAYFLCEVLHLDIPECMTCDIGFYKTNKSGKYICEKCTEKQLTTCDGNSEESCRSCNNNCTFLDGLCHETHCLKHTLFYETIPSECIQCAPGYIAIDSEYCSKSDGCIQFDGDKCIHCHEQYMLTDKYTCEPCNSLCKTCLNDANSCTSCYPNTHAVSLQTCEKCEDDGCRYCDEDKTICTECYESYVLDDGKCYLDCFESNGLECTICRDLVDLNYVFYLPTNGKCLKYQPTTEDSKKPIIDKPEL